MRTNKELIEENIRLSSIVMKELNKKGLLKLNKVLRETIKEENKW